MKHQETAYRLKTALDRLNMRAQELSDRSGVAKASISQYINGTHKPSNVSAGKMASVLGVDPLWLMGFDVPMASTSSTDETSTQDQGWYLNPEVAEKAQEIYEDPETRILLDAKRDLSMEDLEAVLNIVKALKAKEGK